jgi:asparagine synthase (glutamine-hydrolysing)
MCELAQIGVVFPLLDDDLVAFSAELEPRIKLKGLKLRWFFKEALRGFLPDETLAKSKQGFGLPFGLWVKEHEGLDQLAGDSLTNLKTRGIIRPEFIDRLWNTYIAEHPVYYGPTVWVLMMLEQWLSHHVPHWRL